MRARELMTAQPVCCTPETSVRDAAMLMVEHDCGCIPVVETMESGKLIGMITDRDIACRCIAKGHGPDTEVRDTMSATPKSCGPDDDIAAVENIMASDQVRRVPVVDESGKCVGIIAQADLALNRKATTDGELHRVVEKISEPAHLVGSASESST